MIITSSGIAYRTLQRQLRVQQLATLHVLVSNQSCTAEQTPLTIERATEHRNGHSVNGSPLTLYSQSRQFNTSLLRFRKMNREEPDDVEAEEEEKDDEDVEEEPEEPGKDWKDIQIFAKSNRLDYIVANANIGIGRTKIESLVHAGKFRVNGQMPKGAAEIIGVGDIIDLILGPNEENDKLTNVTRILIDEVQSEVDDRKKKIIILGKKWKKVVVEDVDSPM